MRLDFLGKIEVITYLTNNKITGKGENTSRKFY